MRHLLPRPSLPLHSRSHISNNAEDGLAGFDMGQQEADNYFKQVRVYYRVFYWR